MDSLLGFIAGKAADSAFSQTAPIVNKIYSTKIVDTATEQQVKAILLNKYGDTVFYNDIDTYIMRNNIIHELISSLRGEKKLQANNEDEFVEFNLKAFVGLYSKYKYEIVTLANIKSVFKEIFTLVYKAVMVKLRHGFQITGVVLALKDGLNAVFQLLRQRLDALLTLGQRVSVPGCCVLSHGADSPFASGERTLSESQARYLQRRSGFRSSHTRS